jgi:hypothetical protein
LVYVDAFCCSTSSNVKSLVLVLPGTEDATTYFIEVEVCYKGGNEIAKKCAAYVRAWERSTTGFPYVVIVAPNDDRRAAMQEVVDGMGTDGELFKVCVVGELVGTIRGEPVSR